jgi:hypothetical protein
MGVDLRRLEILMSKHFLRHADIKTGFQQMSRLTVAK